MFPEPLKAFEVFQKQVLLAPRQVRVRLLEHIEELLAEILPERTYPFDYLAYRVTGHRPTETQDLTLSGNDASLGLARVLEETGRTVSVQADSIEEPVLTVHDLSQRWRVSTATIMRWRKAGLPGRLFRFAAGRRKIGVRRSLALRFEKDRARFIERARLRRRLTDGERREILASARLALSREDPPEAILSDLAREFELRRSTLLRLFSSAAGDIPSLTALTRTSITQRERDEIFRRVESGEDAGVVAVTTDRSPESVRRIWARGRARRIIRQRIKVTWSEEFADAEARKRIMDFDLPSGKAGVANLPVLSRENETALFRKYNCVKHTARELRKGLDVRHPDESLMDRLDALFAEAQRIRDVIVRSNVRLVMAIAKRHFGRKTSFQGLVSDGNMALLDAVETFDYTRGNRFSTYAGWAIVRRFARTVPEDNYRLASIDSEVLESTARFEVDFTAPKPAAVMQGMSEALRRLPKREREVIESRFGIGDHAKPRTLAEIGAVFGVTKERIRQIESQGLKRLRKIVESTVPELVP